MIVGFALHRRDTMNKLPLGDSEYPDAIEEKNLEREAKWLGIGALVIFTILILAVVAMLYL